MLLRRDYMQIGMLPRGRKVRYGSKRATEGQMGHFGCEVKGEVKNQDNDAFRVRVELASPQQT